MEILEGLVRQASAQEPHAKDHEGVRVVRGLFKAVQRRADVRVLDERGMRRRRRGHGDVRRGHGRSTGKSSRLTSREDARPSDNDRSLEAGRALNKARKGTNGADLTGRRWPSGSTQSSKAGPGCP